MKTVLITCDICGDEMTYEPNELSLQGWICQNNHGYLFDVVKHCCDRCRSKIILSLRVAFNDAKQCIREDKAVKG